LQLTNTERAMLAGDHGEAVRKAIAQQIEVGKFFGAPQLIASQTVFAGKPGHTCEGKDGNICNSGTEGCNCKNIIQTRNKD